MKPSSTWKDWFKREYANAERENSAWGLLGIRGILHLCVHRLKADRLQTDFLFRRHFRINIVLHYNTSQCARLKWLEITESHHVSPCKILVACRGTKNIYIQRLSTSTSTLSEQQRDLIRTHQRSPVKINLTKQVRTILLYLDDMRREACVWFFFFYVWGKEVWCDCSLHRWIRLLRGDITWSLAALAVYLGGSGAGRGAWVAVV